MHTEHLNAALRIFVVGFSGVFLNLGLLLAALKILAYAVARSAGKNRETDQKGA